jgi:hypothetical protein
MLAKEEATQCHPLGTVFQKNSTLESMGVIIVIFPLSTLALIL